MMELVWNRKRTLAAGYLLSHARLFTIGDAQPSTVTLVRDKTKQKWSLELTPRLNNHLFFMTPPQNFIEQLREEVEEIDDGEFAGSDKKARTTTLQIRTYNGRFESAFDEYGPFMNVVRTALSSSWKSAANDGVLVCGIDMMKLNCYNRNGGSGMPHVDSAQYSVLHRAV